tara:strand:+ start:270 stop:698 length:429 start_codon:yes stop_codon:yes gene_type:complete
VLTILLWVNDHFKILDLIILQYVVFGVGYWIGTFFITPDLDIYDSKVNKAWSSFRFIWYPYSQCFRHGRTSHSPIVGTLSRIIYLLLLLGIILLITTYFGLETSGYRQLFNENWQYIILLLVGMIIANISHVFMDVITKQRR